VAIAAELPDRLKIERMLPAKLPKSWRDAIAPEVLKDIGTTWATRGSTVALCVPSAIIPEEENILINPTHPDFKKLKIGIPRNFSFDPRMRKK
jgi:RES domain-containing protein